MLPGVDGRSILDLGLIEHAGAPESVGQLAPSHEALPLVSDLVGTSESLEQRTPSLLDVPQITCDTAAGEGREPDRGRVARPLRGCIGSFQPATRLAEVAHGP